MILSICLLSLIDFYLLNVVLAYAVSYFEVISKRTILIKIIYIFGIIVALLGLFKLHTYSVVEIISGLVKKENAFVNIYTELSIEILGITAIVFLIFYFLMLKHIKNNLYIILNPHDGNSITKNSFFDKLLNLRTNNLYRKILAKDICCFTRKRGIDFYMVLLFQIGAFILNCMTILQDRPNELFIKLQIVGVFYMICATFGFMVSAVTTVSNKKEITIEKECSVINKFNIKVDKFKVLRYKSYFIFIIASFSTGATILTNFLLDISFNGLVQNLLIAALLLSWLRYCSLMGVDIANFGFNEIRIIFFVIVAVAGGKIVFSTLLSNEQLILKYLLIVIINTLGYYIEMLLIKLLERAKINA
jgi:hypothetical protein